MNLSISRLDKQASYDGPERASVRVSPTVFTSSPVEGPVMLDEDTWMTPAELASANSHSLISVAFDTGLYNYYDRKFGDYAAAVAELIRP